MKIKHYIFNWLFYVFFLPHRWLSVQRVHRRTSNSMESLNSFRTNPRTFIVRPAKAQNILHNKNVQMKSIEMIRVPTAIRAKVINKRIICNTQLIRVKFMFFTRMTIFNRCVNDANRTMNVRWMIHRPKGFGNNNNVIASAMSFFFVGNGNRFSDEIKMDGVSLKFGKPFCYSMKIGFHRDPWACVDMDTMNKLQSAAMTQIIVHRILSYRQHNFVFVATCVRDILLNIDHHIRIVGICHYLLICTNFAYAIEFDRSENVRVKQWDWEKSHLHLTRLQFQRSWLVYYFIATSHKPQATHLFKSQMHILISIREKINSAFHASSFHPWQARVFYLWSFLLHRMG